MNILIFFYTKICTQYKELRITQKKIVFIFQSLIYYIKWKLSLLIKTNAYSLDWLLKITLLNNDFKEKADEVVP